MELSQTVPLMRKSDSSYLKKSFQLIANKGHECVRREKIHGSNREIEEETLRILKDNKKRFNQSVERRNEFKVGNYLSNIIANEDAIV